MTIFFTQIESPFSRALAGFFTANGDTVTFDPAVSADFFIDTTDCRDPGDDRAAGDGIDAEAAVQSFRANVSEPLALLSQVLPRMRGKRRVCFLTTRDASVNWSTATTGYGRNMAKAALHQILTISKNGLREKGFTFRLFDPMTGEVPPEKAAASAYACFTRDRFDDGWGNGPGRPDRDDENNLVIRDALGREIPW